MTNDSNFSNYCEFLKNRITLDPVPFTDRDSRLLVFRHGNDSLWVGLAEYEKDPTVLPPIEAWRFTDEAGEPLAYELTTYPHQVIVQAGQKTWHITFADSETLLIVLPTGRGGLTLQTQMSQAVTDRRGGLLSRTGESPLYLTYTTNARLLQNEIVELSSEKQEIRLQYVAEQEAALLLNITRSPGFNRSVPRPALVLEANMCRWNAWFGAAPKVAEVYHAQYYYAWWVMAVNLLRPYFHPKREGMVPSKLGYVGIWHWDSYFHALALRHISPELAKEQLRIMFDYQLANGLIPDIVHDEGILAHTCEIVEADITKPPLTAWAAWKLYERDGDAEFLNELYDGIIRFQNWWFAASDLDHNGLCEYLHPWSSGLDNSPLWDQGLPVESPDLSAYLCMQYDYLARIAEVIGRPEDAPQWRERAAQLAQRMIDLRWDGEAGLFWATRNGMRIPARTPFNLFPLITGRMPIDIADRLVATLTDERQFWANYPVPTVALDDPSYNPLSMWRGPVWLNINYLLIDGLLRAGYTEQARQLRTRTIAMVMAAFQLPSTSAHDIYEYYHPLTGEKPPRATYAFGWSAALFIDLVISASGDGASEA